MKNKKTRLIIRLLLSVIIFGFANKSTPVDKYDFLQVVA